MWWVSALLGVTKYDFFCILFLYTFVTQLKNTIIFQILRLAKNMGNFGRKMCRQEWFWEDPWHYFEMLLFGFLRQFFFRVICCLRIPSSYLVILEMDRRNHWKGKYVGVQFCIISILLENNGLWQGMYHQLCSQSINRRGFTQSKHDWELMPASNVWSFLRFWGLKPSLRLKS